jgi:hypothetical protein
MLAELDEAEQHLQSVAGQVIGTSPEETSIRRSLDGLVEDTVAARRALAATLITAQPASWARSGDRR